MSKPPFHVQGWRRLFSPFHVTLQFLLAILIIFSDALERHYNFWIGVVLVVGVPAILVLLIWVGGLLKNLIQRRWWKLAAVALAPLVVWPLTILTTRAGFDADWVRFQYSRADYTKTVQALGATHPLSHSWDWGGTGGLLTVSDFTSLVYDESDQVMRRNGNEYNGGYTSVRSFGDHFYLVTQSYGG